MLQLDRVKDADEYLKEALEQGGGDDVTYNTVLLIRDFMAGVPDWEKHEQWASAHPSGFTVEGTAAISTFI